MTIEDALTLSSERGLSLVEAARLCGESTASIGVRLDSLALEVASRYLTDATSFTAADSLMNVLFAYAAQTTDLPSTFMRVYEAFDRGEYHHASDGEGVDPEVKYTKPLLNALLVERLLPNTSLERTREG